MTIYTPSQNEKDKAKLIPEVVTDSMVDVKEPLAQDAPGPRVLEVTYFRRNNRSFYVHLLFALAGLGILACGALGAVVFYRHLHKIKQQSYSGRCGAIYFDTAYHDSLQSPFSEEFKGEKAARDKPAMDYLEEEMMVEEDYYEELHTPAFDEVRESYVRHDFKMNYTAIVDHRYKHCFLMKLNRTAISPPRTIIELIHLSIKSHGFLRAEVIRQDYQVAFAMQDMSGVGPRITRDCSAYPTHWLEKRVSGVFKRSTDIVEEVDESAAYAMLSNSIDKQTIYKVFIHNIHKVKVSAAA